jgi:hypothetical protein
MIKKGLIAGIAVFIVGFGLNFLAGAVVPGVQEEYMNQNLFRPWEDPLMMAFFLYPFIFGIVGAYLWGLLKDHLKGDSTKKALEFARIYFIVATIPGMIATYTSFQISLSMVLLWAVTGYVEAFVAGYIFAKMK